jgi:hypothetical protein
MLSVLDELGGAKQLLNTQINYRIEGPAQRGGCQPPLPPPFLQPLLKKLDLWW